MIHKILLLFVFTISILYSNVKEENSLEKITIQFNWKYKFQFAGFIAAKEKGFYEEVGLDVHFLEKKGSENLVDALIDKKFNYLVVSSKFLLHEKASTNLKFLANYFKQSPFALVTQKDITSLQSLYTSKVMVSKETLYKDSISFMLYKLNVDKDKIKLIEPTHNIEDFISKKVDVIDVYTTNELYELNKRNVNYNIFYPANFGLNAPDVNLISTNETYNLNKEITKKLIKATNRGWEYALENSDELVNIIYEKYSKERSLELLKYEATKTKELILPESYAIGSIDLEFFSSYINYLNEIHEIEYSIKNIVYTPKTLQLSQKEIKWLSTNKELEIIVNKNSAPLVFFNKQKKEYEGIMIDYLKEVSKYTGLKFKYKELTKFNSKNSRIEFIDSPSIAVLKTDDEYIITSAELIPKKLVTDSFAIYFGLKKDYPTIDIDYDINYESAINKIESGEREIFLSNLISSKYWSKKKLMPNIKIIRNGGYDIPYFFEFTRKLDKTGETIIKKSLDKIGKNKKVELYSKWSLDEAVEPFDYSLIYKIVLVIVFVILFVVFWNINLKKKVDEKTNKINELMIGLEEKVEERTKSLNEVKEDLEELLGKTMSSIEYALLIQHAVIPDPNVLKNVYEKSFVIWQPKDIVGGDIYLFETLRNENESLLFVIDCTGHGVPGAFVTMLVKAIQRELVLEIINSSDEVSPSLLLQKFDRILKEVLKRKSKNANVEVGFDGGVLYYKKDENYIKYAGAKTPLFYICNNELTTIKSNKCSIGYSTSHLKSLEFKEEKIEIKGDTYLYLTTDGYLDQNGGEEGFSFGKRKFQKLILENHKKDFEEQKNILLNTIENYKEDEPVNDDMAIVGIKLTKHEENNNYFI